MGALFDFSLLKIVVILLNFIMLVLIGYVTPFSNFVLFTDIIICGYIPLFIFVNANLIFGNILK
tara:strand:+ start:907 stop:1098 length:192 start_codon:yes stop_codon:yes gene_type:complete